MSLFDTQLRVSQIAQYLLLDVVYSVAVPETVVNLDINSGPTEHYALSSLRILPLLLLPTPGHDLISTSCPEPDANGNDILDFIKCKAILR